jgi:recombination protein RecT
MTDVAKGSTTALAERVADRAANPAAPGKTLQQRLRELGGEIAKALPNMVSPERFVRIVLTEIRETPKLAECTPESFLGAVMQSAQLGLEFGPLGLAYLVPYKNKGVMECQLIVGYKGYLALARRSGEIKQIVARAVHEKDTFRVWTDENGDHLLYERGEGEDRGEIIKYFGLATFINGGSHVEVMSLSEIKKRKDRSASANASFSPWKSDEEAMSKKTVVRAMIPWIPLATEVAQAIAGDEQINVLSSEGGVQVRYIDTQEVAPGSGPTIDPEAIAEQITNALNLVEPTNARLDCSRHLLQRFGPIDAITAEDVDAVLDVIEGWPETRVDMAAAAAQSEGVQVVEEDGDSAGRFSPELEEALNAYPGDDVDRYLESIFGEDWPNVSENQLMDAIEEAIAGSPGTPEGTEPPDEASAANLRLPGTDLGVSGDLLASTKAAIDVWDIEICKRVLGQFNLPRTGNLGSMRLRLLTYLAPLRQAGDPAAEDLF